MISTGRACSRGVRRGRYPPGRACRVCKDGLAPAQPWVQQACSGSVSRLFSPLRTPVPSSEHGHSERLGQGPRAPRRDMHWHTVLGFPSCSPIPGNLSKSRRRHNCSDSSLSFESCFQDTDLKFKGQGLAHFLVRLASRKEHVLGG